MVSIETLFVITAIVIGFGLVPLLGALLPRDLEDDD
jgi:multisubunit Na+/H+ antiporter MnhC subunit